MPLSIIYFIILNSLTQQESHVDLYLDEYIQYHLVEAQISISYHENLIVT